VQAKKYGGYDSAFEEARKDLDPLELGRLCQSMRAMSHEYRSQDRLRTEAFKLTSADRDQLIQALIDNGTASSTTADLVGCSKEHVRVVAQKAKDASESPETGASKPHTELPLVVACPAQVAA